MADDEWCPDHEIVLPDGKIVPVMIYGEAILTHEDWIADGLHTGPGPNWYTYLHMSGSIAKINPIEGATLRYVPKRTSVHVAPGVVLTGASMTCPHCGETKPAEDFGFRRMGDGTVRNQSWCRACRT